MISLKKSLRGGAWFLLWHLTSYYLFLYPPLHPLIDQYPKKNTVNYNCNIFILFLMYIILIYVYITKIKFKKIIFVFPIQHSSIIK
jgi:hypothetical protein